MSAIVERRSVRNFLPKPVEPEKIERILKAACAAPSAHNRQPWEFLVITAREDLDAVAGMSPYAKMCTEATAAIVPCVNLKIGGAEPEDAWWVQDLSAATENILLQIVEEGLGGVWLGWYPDSKRPALLGERFKLPPHIVPFSVVALGYAAKPTSPSNRFDPAKVHYGIY
jgi:nitroreductase